MQKMAVFDNILLCSSLLLLFIVPTLAQTSFRPKALVLPVTKDSSTLQYLTQINQRTPQVPIKLTLHLSGRFLWVDCDRDFVSASYKPVRCNTAQCSLASRPNQGPVICGNCFSTQRPGCNNNTCSLVPYNPIAPITTSGEISQDVVTIHSTDGSSSGETVTVPNFIFSCAPTRMLEGLANGVVGMAGLGRSTVSIPIQLSAAFSFPRKFAVCLGSSTSAKGVVFFGDGPYNMLPGIDVSKSLSYTPLILNPVSWAGIYFRGNDYLIGVKSIKVNNQTVPLNTSLLAITRTGLGGTKISTVDPYTSMETSIYKAVTDAFAREMSGIAPRVSPVAPFGLCFDGKNLGRTRVGPTVPPIDLVLQSSRVYWRISGANSMVQVKNDVMCLGFVDGGVDPESTIVIGGHQLEDHLLQFDLATSRLGFSSSLLSRHTTCSNFNFTSSV